MMYLMRKRQIAGNVCLVVFLAFLFTIISPMLFAGSAEAASIDEVQVVDSEGVEIPEGTEVEVSRDPENIDEFLIEINLAIMGSAPLTADSFESILVDLAGLGQVSLADLAKTQVSSSVYNGVYTTVYQFVYNVASPASLPVYLTASIYNIGDMSVLDSVYLKLVDKVPIETGEVVFDDDGNAEAIVDEGSLGDQLTPGSDLPVIIEVPNLDVPRITVTIPPTVIDTVLDQGRSVVLGNDIVAVAFSPEALDIPAIRNAIANGDNIQIVITQVPAGTTGGLTVAGGVYDIDLVVDGVNVSNLGGETIIVLPYTGTRPDKAGVYYRSGSRWIYVDSEVDEESGTAIASTDHFTVFAVMEDITPPAKLVVNNKSMNNYKYSFIKLTGKAEANSTVKIYRNKKLAATVKASPAGNYVAKVNLSLGNNVIAGRAVDRFNNVGAASKTITIKRIPIADFEVTKVQKTKSGIYVTLANKGSKSISNVKTYIITRNGKVYVRYVNLGAGKSARIYVKGKFTTGSVVVDPGNKVNEVNEKNNTKAF